MDPAVTEVPQADTNPEPAPLSPVRLDKFIALSLATLGFYPVVWFYRNWKAFKLREGADIWPGARALFSPIFYHSFLKRVEGVQGKAGLAVAYVLITVVGGNSPVFALGALGFLAVIPAVRGVATMSEGQERPPSYGWRVRSAAVGILGLPFVLVMVMSPWMNTQSRVMAGSDVSRDLREFLLERGALEEGEEIVLFYSEGVFSAEEEGFFLSQYGVTMYQTDPFADETTVYYLSYDRINEVEENPIPLAPESVQVLVRESVDAWLSYPIPTADGQASRVIGEIRRRAEAAKEALTDLPG